MGSRGKPSARPTSFSALSGDCHSTAASWPGCTRAGCGILNSRKHDPRPSEPIAATLVAHGTRLSSFASSLRRRNRSLHGPLSHSATCARLHLFVRWRNHSA